MTLIKQLKLFFSIILILFVAYSACFGKSKIDSLKKGDKIKLILKNQSQSGIGSLLWQSGDSLAVNYDIIGRRIYRKHEISQLFLQKGYSKKALRNGVAVGIILGGIIGYIIEGPGRQEGGSFQDPVHYHQPRACVIMATGLAGATIGLLIATHYRAYIEIECDTVFSNGSQIEYRKSCSKNFGINLNFEIKL